MIISACSHLQLFFKIRVSDPNISKGSRIQHEQHNPHENKQAQCLTEFEFAFRATSEACATELTVRAMKVLRRTSPLVSEY